VLANGMGHPTSNFEQLKILREVIPLLLF